MGLALMCKVLFLKIFTSFLKKVFMTYGKIRLQSKNGQVVLGVGKFGEKN